MELTLLLDVFGELLHTLFSFLVIDHVVIPDFFDILLYLIEFFFLRDLFHLLPEVFNNIRNYLHHVFPQLLDLLHNLV